MLRVKRNFKHLIHRNVRRITNYGVQYAQRCDLDECDCVISQPKCKKRYQVVKEVNCDKCIFECWEYKPRPRFVPKKTQEDVIKEQRYCSPGMEDPKLLGLKEQKLHAEKCQYINRVDAPIGCCRNSAGCCSKTFKGKAQKPCKENPFQFENDKIPAADWDFDKKAAC